MDGANFEKVFEDLKTIQSKVVSKAKYEESQNEVEKLKSLLEVANGQVRGLVEELKNMRTKRDSEKEELRQKMKIANSKILKEIAELKAQREEQKLNFDVVEAEKKRIEAESNNWEARYNEINLKLKLKNHQLKSMSADGRKSKTSEAQKRSTGTQTIKNEPVLSIGTVNVPSSTEQTSPSSVQKNPKSAVVRGPSLEACFNMQAKLGIKRKRFESESPERRISERLNKQKIFNCADCIAEWADEFEERQLIGESLDPMKYISKFPSAEKLKLHMIEKHFWKVDAFCKEKNCLQADDKYIFNNCFPHGDLVCDTCEKTFMEHDDLEIHSKMIHGNVTQMSCDELLELKRVYMKED